MASAGSAAASLEHEYDAYLASIGHEMQAVAADAHKPGTPGAEARARLARLEQARTDFCLRAAPILARCYQGVGSRQALYEELATLTANVEAIARIHEARIRREEALAAASRGPNDRKRRRRELPWSRDDILCHRPGCDGVMLVLRSAEIVCEACGYMREFNEVSTAGLAFNERAPVSESSYSKQTHLAELLQNVQGRERTEVPSEVVDAVRAELRKFRQLDRPEKITALVVRGHLRRIKQARWYDHAQQIAMTASGNRCPRVVLPPELERDLHAAFARIIVPFQRAIRGFKRSNMLAYSYYVIKRCELNGFARYKKHFRLLKNQAKIAQCDRWWKSICQDLGWPFKPTV